ncbi:MAG: hypothetical protein WBK46_05760 [Ruminococcus flavefaciens]
MSTNSSNTQDNSNESAVEAFKNLISKLEEKGQDVDGILADLGGKNTILQYLQDIEDDVVNDLNEVFKQAYAEGDLRRCIHAVISIATDDFHVYKRGIRKVLYSEGNLLKNPLHYNFTQNDYEKTQTILFSAIENLKEQALKEESLITQEMSDIYTKELAQLYLMYECLYHNRLKNAQRINESDFLKLELPQILHSFLVFLQSQYDIAKELVHNKSEDNQYLTGFESLVATEKTYLNPNVSVSIVDSFEQLLEDLDTLFRYVYYLKDDTKFAEDEIRKIEFITPYESPEYMMLDTLAMLDTHFASLEAKFRYSEWAIQIQETLDGIDAYSFYPPDDKPYKTHIAAMLRHKYNNMLSMTNENMKRRSKAFDLEGFLLISKRINVNDVESFHFDTTEFRKLAEYTSPTISFLKKQIKPYYLKCRFNDINVDQYLCAFEFIYIFSKVYYCAAKESGVLNALVPLLKLDYLYNEFATIYNLDFKTSKKLIDCYVFDSKTSKKKINGDIYTRPLIGVGANMVLLSEGLIDQMNLERNVEVLLEWNNVNLAPVGKDLERKLITELKGVVNLSVNTTSIEFLAYDRKNIEFDFLAVLDDYLILIELKSLLQPYDDDELARRKKTISYGVEQVKRRVKVVQKDWDKIKANADIELPDKPYDEEHIIKIVCTDVGNYTGLESEGVILTDYATVIKYFKNPYVHGLKRDQVQHLELVQKQVLWEKGHPTANEFIQYLHNPDTMSLFIDCLKPEWKLIPVFGEYKHIAFQDMIVKEDPIKKFAAKQGFS